jgi:hypothetical protein
MIVDYILDDCFQLISLLFLTVGKNNEASRSVSDNILYPASYDCD